MKEAKNMRNIIWGLPILVLTILDPTIVCSQWVQLSAQPGGSYALLAASGTRLFAGTYSNGIYLSSDQGLSWAKKNNGLSSLWILSIGFMGSDIFVGTNGGGLYMSTDSGETWIKRDSGMTTPFVRALAIYGSKIFAATWGGGLFSSIDTGKSWNHIDGGITNTEIEALAVNGNMIFAAGYAGMHSPYPNCLYRSSDGGQTWTQSGDIPSGFRAFSLAVAGTAIYAGGNQLVYMSPNNGTNWIQLHTPVDNINGWYLCALNDTSVLAAPTTSGSLFLITHDGNAWTKRGLDGLQIVSAAVAGQSIFASSGAVWKESISDLMATQPGIQPLTPSEFSLAQNYPNPFNPSTVIAFDLPNRSTVAITVYSTIGQLVETIALGQQGPGHHTFQFNASGLSCGAYFYRVQAGTSSATRMMILLK